MYLKRIELTGFKSFADKTELEFVPGITAVVGPNGSGKSNISDGIRWVLGEQSAKSLRGGNMQDVIFSGSDTRKPVNFGEVSLTLDNSDFALPLDFSEVTVTRRLHRSGESEYFINRQPCRLKDITELFMDTGIGKEAYSIIGQGRIDEILSTRSEDRRILFEEASGIVKYKTRKKEAVRKLEDTEQNLLRIHDLVTELEDQLEPLARQSETAQHYKQLREQLKSNEISMYVAQIDQLHESWREAESRLKELETRQLELSTVVSRHDAKLEKQRLELRQLEEELEALRERLLQISESHDEALRQSEVLKERRRNLQSNRSQLEQTIEAQANRQTERQAERELLQAKLAEIDGQLEALKKELLAEEARLSGVSGDAGEEERLKAELIDLLSRLAQAKNEWKHAGQQDDVSGRRLAKFAEERDALSGQLAALDKRISELNERIRERGREVDGLRNAYLKASEDMQLAVRQLEMAEKALRDGEQKWEALVARRDTIREMQNDYDGFMHGVREVLKRKNVPGGLAGIHGAVVELIKVDRKHETAIETALGSALQNIVVETEADARQAIYFLKQKQLGRATFLPLDVIRERAIPDREREEAAKQKGFVGVAVDLVRYDARYDAVMRNLLGQIIVADGLEEAGRIAAACRYRYRVVTLDGDVVNAGGSMTGGSRQKQGANLLGRSRQIEAMDKEIAEFADQLAKLKDKRAEWKKKGDELAASLDTLRQEGERKRLEEQQLKADLKQAESERNLTASQLAAVEQEMAAEEAERKGAAGRKDELEREIAAMEQEEARIQEAIRQAELSRRQSEEEREKRMGALTDLKVRLAALNQERTSLREQLDRLESEMAGAESERAASRSVLEQLDRDLADSGAEIAALEERAARLSEEKSACSEQIEFKRAERAERNARLDEMDGQIRDERRALQQVEEELRQTEVRAGRLDVELETMLKKLSEEYELSYEFAKQRYPAPEDLIAVQQRVRSLKREIAELGEVNLGAIDEYARVKERHAFLSAQRDDLIEAKTTLYQVIKEMNEEMSRRFKTTFDAIRAQFSIVFTRLFGGGRADLVLEDPDNLLETGIEIVAQPPGKKLQNLQLLSGGEKALTALALLFAILRVKPVPFCVLDEVEAALDEANVTRFAEYLREFSQDTQFIVVTHRKGTMSEADVLYGVTMENDGVSKLVSVRLEDADDLIPA
jgi:chromosome segregation protein